jgi:hypothetical protein
MNYIHPVDYQLLMRIKEVKKTITRFEVFDLKNYDDQVLRLVNKLYDQILSIEDSLIRDPKMTTTRMVSLLNDAYTEGAEGVILRCSFIEESNYGNFNFIDLKLW